MKRALTLAACLVTALAITSAATADTAKIAKKKKTYCQKQGASIKAKLKGKSHGFYVYAEKGGAGILLCQDKPKFTGDFSMDQGDKISDLKVSAKKCAGFRVSGKAHNPEVYLFNFSDFLSGNGQGSIYEAGRDLTPGTASIQKFALSTNCVAAFGQWVAGVPQVVVKGTSAFGYTGEIYPRIGPNTTDKELGALSVESSGATATASWSESGVKHTYVYTNASQPQNPPPTT
jgi:hypothetical protein